MLEPLEPTGTFWLHVHPDYLVGDDEWALVRLARNWREGVLPEPGGTQDQAALTVAAIEIILSTWGLLRAAADRKNRKE